MEGRYGAPGEDRGKTQMKRDRRLGVVADLGGEIWKKYRSGLGEGGVGVGKGAVAYAAEQAASEWAREKEEGRGRFVTRFKMDLAELREVVRTQALRLKQRVNTWPMADEAGPLPVPEFKATRAWVDVAPLYMEGGVRGRAGGGRRGGGEGAKRATGGDKRGGGEVV